MKQNLNKKRGGVKKRSFYRCSDHNTNSGVTDSAVYLFGRGRALDLSPIKPWGARHMTFLFLAVLEVRWGCCGVENWADAARADASCRWAVTDERSERLCSSGLTSGRDRAEAVYRRGTLLLPRGLIWWRSSSRSWAKSKPRRRGGGRGGDSFSSMSNNLRK